jgi:hypothetical protein
VDPNTFYYTLSTIPQVVSAIVALAGVYTIFRVQSLERLLVGHGQSVLNRWGSSGYKLKNTTADSKQRRRLEDAVARGSVEEIGAVIAVLRDEEKQQGRTLETNPGGLADLYERRFTLTHARAKDLRRQTRAAIGLAVASIFLSILSLALADIILRGGTLVGIAVAAVNLVLFGAVLLDSWRLARSGLSEHPAGRRNEGYAVGIVE